MSGSSTRKRKIGGDEDSRITDPRFANVQSDPRYRLPSKRQKVKLDKRFTQKFRDEDFTRRAKVDRYGRRIQNDSEQRRLREKFDLEDEEELSDEPDNDDEIQAELARVEQQQYDPLRQGKDVSSSEEDSSTDDDSSDSETEDVVEAALARQKEDVPEGEVSTRIAVVNLDWDNIRAADLMVVVSSFLPAGGRLLKVSVYPSEFGKERIEREEMEGPPKEIFAQRAGVEDSDEERSSEEESEQDDEDIKASIIKPDDGSEFDSQALRQYQLERLRYYYAVLTFSSKDVAKSIYDAVDGAEYLSTANFFDLRFIPEDMDFSDDKPRDECEHVPTSYKPNDFVTDALQHSKVKLTWDAEDPSRKEAQARAFKGGQKEIDENDLKAYLGSDTSGDEGEDVEDQDMGDIDEKMMSKKDAERQKARALLGLAPEPAKKSSKKGKDAHVGDIQITFSSGLSSATNRDEKKRSVFENSPEPQETTVERYKRKEKERKLKRKEKMKAARSGEEVAADSDDEPEVATSTKDDGLGFDDPFFADSVTENAKQKNKLRKEERLKKRQEREAEEAASAKQRAELELLMADNDDESAQQAGATGKGHVVRHFDMNEIEKAEKGKNKWQKRKEKKSKRVRPESERDESHAASTMQDDFKMDTTDARFGKLFENHEFAIDPTNPGLRKTKAMKELMEEGRRRKDTSSKSKSLKSGEVTANADPSVTKDGGRRGHRSKDSTSSELKDLVAKIKRKG